MTTSEAAAATVNVAALEAALAPIARAVLADLKGSKGSKGVKGAEGVKGAKGADGVKGVKGAGSNDDEFIKVLSGMFHKLVVEQLMRASVEHINRIDIAFGDQPEVACLRGKKLRVTAPLGEGAFGRVYAMGAKMAVKIATLQRPRKQESIQALQDAFENEVAMGRKAHGLGIGPRVIDAFVCASPHNALYGIIVMERVNGKQLNRWMAGAKPVQVAALRDKLYTMLETMHAAGLYHNDLHTENVMVTPSGKPVIIDFGFATGTADGRRRVLTRHDAKRHRDFWVLRIMEEDRGGKEGRDKEGVVGAVSIMVREVLRRAVASGVIRFALE
jgi:predicted Ser/Thr protein kinase